MKNSKLNKEEKDILNAFESGKLESVKDASQEKESLQKYASNTLHKRRNINIRISERDLQRIKALAAKQGLPYQTLISSVLHRISASKEKKDRILEE